MMLVSFHSVSMILESRWWLHFIEPFYTTQVSTISSGQEINEYLTSMGTDEVPQFVCGLYTFFIDPSKPKIKSIIIYKFLYIYVSFGLHAFLLQ